MSLKTILACLTTKEHAADVLNVAVPLARRNGAHLVGLHTLQALEVYPGVAVHISEEVISNFRAKQRQEADAIEAVFKAHTESEDFVSEYRVVNANASLASERMVESARAADLVIMAHEDKAVDRFDQRRAQADVIRQGGRPVIVVPSGYTGPEIGHRIMLGWSDTREAARAAHDMLMVAAPGAEIDVLRIGAHAEDELRDSDMLDMTAALARHGHKVELRHLEKTGHAIADILLEKAFERGADLVATGAFGHSGVYDFVLGATSKALLRDDNLPVLFSK